MPKHSSVRAYRFAAIATSPQSPFPWATSIRARPRKYASLTTSIPGMTPMIVIAMSSLSSHDDEDHQFATAFAAVKTAAIQGRKA